MTSSSIEAAVRNLRCPMSMIAAHQLLQSQMISVCRMLLRWIICTCTEQRSRNAAVVLPQPARYE